MSYDRYNKFRFDGKINKVVTVKIPVKSSDYYEIYEKGKTRLDLLSFKYYGDPNYDWLILMANPSLGNMEFEIPDNSEIRIPYPLNLTLAGYEDNINKYNTLY